jgi:putative methionine-R-sulfoxide reductase with GAF domain
MKPTFIQVTEIWIPSPDRMRLDFAGGLHGPHGDFAAAAAGTHFNYDEGLPGKAWAERRPIVLADLQGSAWFRRKDAARAAGLTSGIAFPIFAGDYLLAVVTFFCGDDDENVGAIELWHNDAKLSTGMKLLEGYFGILDNFRFTASHTTFMRGFGLPGLVWESGLPVLLADLGSSQRFLRRDDARRVGINKGLGLPCQGAPGQQYVMTFLSALGTPIARRFEVWVPDAALGGLVIKDGLCDREPDFTARYADVVIPDGTGLLGSVMRTGLPAVSANIAAEDSPVGAAASSARLSNVIALPMLTGGRLTAIVAMYF